MKVVIFANHGDHGHFLHMALSVLIGEAEIYYNDPIFDFWTAKKSDTEIAKLTFQRRHKTQVNDKKLENYQSIWIERDKPLLYAYNLLTRGILGKTDLQKNKKSIDILDFEKYPYKFCNGSDQTRYTNFGKIKIKQNGIVSKKDLKRWYRETVLSDFETLDLRLRPKNYFSFPISSFYNQDNWQKSLFNLEKYLNLDFSWKNANKLFNLLEEKLTYNIESVYSNNTALLDTYNYYFFTHSA